ncbi:MAG: Preprotein translocase subunit E [Parcubacteria group bacterium GW2011_GWB1_45_7]|uniref:Protein translocase subunit SecE n=3 Tax=Parcubacteria group TaxID=1794811 RepID=A0A0H4T3W7_9BACT|nr:Preprotein translocase SecE subunit [uncultured Parcubacteria bacterium Rifle_16ft_4_minimus_37647]KKU11647.1 MAG: Preprotein translocase subunit E [Parcubacteria group bacterium GW2011_GWB1_45_7]KKW16675.1 MAG: Preprotein translocase subunit E [Parcubacteria group bacterium GW2011_GWA1_50_14]OGY58110.1 MAG: preprotein translocase subunit SecE [Candidatus Colwellbacteria bacterium RIFCSPHIGHO2_02_FULL_45_17]OGY60489.1 MAG: preprotein translocase subunit SecE [Candidatus Colwellbacteria bacte
MFGKFKLFIGELRQEFKRINWPGRKETVKMSVTVIVISMLVAAFLGALDFLFVSIIEKLIA